MTTPFLVGIRLIAGPTLCITFAIASADTTSQYSIAPPSSWVRSEQQIADPGAAGPVVERKVDYLLVDRQIRVGERGSSH